MKNLIAIDPGANGGMVTDFELDPAKLGVVTYTAQQFMDRYHTK